MPKSQTGPLYLRRVDPAQNMRRFYTLAIQPTLFGGASVVRNERPRTANLGNSL